MKARREGFFKIPLALALSVALSACSGGGAMATIGRDAGASAGKDADATAGSVAADGGGASAIDAGRVTSASDAAPADACSSAAGCSLGVWSDVTPPDVDLTHDLDCGNYGTQSMQVDANKPNEFYTLFMCQGIWKSIDYGQHWTGPINSGSQGALMGDCAGGITLPPNDRAAPPIVYAACIRGNGLGFWSSTNGGVDWTRYSVGPGGARQDFYPPVVDPYDAQHLLMAGHEMNVLVESVDGGHTWTSVATDPGMNQNGGTASVFFIDTGDRATTRRTFLWIAQQSDAYGTWRTSDAGMSWTRVDKNEHPHGLSQIYQPDTRGVVYMAGAYSTLGWGVLRSSDYGQTWAHLGITGNEAVVFGTEKHVFAMTSGAVGLGSSLDPNYEIAAQPGTGTWTMPGTPPAMKIGAAQAAVSRDGAHAIVVTANWSAGVWRYVEP